MAILIFDFDGTIHDSMCIYAPAVRACQEEFAAQGLLPEREVPDAQIRGYLGLTAAQMWQAFAPELSPGGHEEGSQFIYRKMVELTRAGAARLYDGTEDMLRELRLRGHRLVFLSNCSVAYMQLHTEHFGLDRFFHEMYCAEQFDWDSKPRIVEKLMRGWIAGTERQGSGEKSVIIAIGDRYTDMEIRLAKVPEPKQPEMMIRTVFCTYGFGEPEEGRDADAFADCVPQIPAAVNNACFTV